MNGQRQQKAKAPATRRQPRQQPTPDDQRLMPTTLPSQALRPAAVLTLQKTVGNRAVQRMLAGQAAAPLATPAASAAPAPRISTRKQPTVIQRLTSEEVEEAIGFIPVPLDAATLKALAQCTTEFEEQGKTGRERWEREIWAKEALATLAGNLIVRQITLETKDDWLAALQEILGRFEEDSAQGEKEEAQNQVERERQQSAKQALDQSVREKMDQTAGQQGLSEYFEMKEEGEEKEESGEKEEHSVGVGMDKFQVLHLKESDYSLRTDALSSCTGVSLYDPVSQVGALIHVYTKKSYPKLQDKMIPAMEAEAKKQGLKLGPVGGIQAALMPGISEGVNMSHLEDIYVALRIAGISLIRDFSKEGRKSGSFRLTFGGKVTNG